MPSRFRAVEVKAAKPVALKPVRPNLGVEAEYRRRVKKLLSEMHKSVVYWIAARYGQNEPLIAQDGTITFSSTNEGVKSVEGVRVTRMPSPVLALDEIPANELRAALRALSKRWLRNFDELAPALAKYFSLATNKRTDAALAAILKKGGFTVDFKMTKAMRDVVNATTAANVGLIKSIPQKYLGEVEGAVMRSIQEGRNLGDLTTMLQETYKVSERRAALIAKDQNNKATSSMNRARQIELGVTQAKWRHSGGGRKPRPQHVAMDGKLYDVKKGMWDPVEKAFVFPGMLVNCRCVSIAVIPGFE